MFILHYEFRNMSRVSAQGAMLSLTDSDSYYALLMRYNLVCLHRTDISERAKGCK